mgnify:CR=1 FL=1
MMSMWMSLSTTTLRSAYLKRGEGMGVVNTSPNQTVPKQISGAQRVMCPIPPNERDERPGEGERWRCISRRERDRSGSGLQAGKAVMAAWVGQVQTAHGDQVRTGPARLPPPLLLPLLLHSPSALVHDVAEDDAGLGG